jgi:hypothetical protein
MKKKKKTGGGVDRNRRTKFDKAVTTLPDYLQMYWRKLRYDATKGAENIRDLTAADGRKV